MSAIAYKKIDRPMHGKLKRPLRQDTLNYVNFFVRHNVFCAEYERH